MKLINVLALFPLINGQTIGHASLSESEVGSSSSSPVTFSDPVNKDSSPRVPNLRRKLGAWDAVFGLVSIANNAGKISRINQRQRARSTTPKPVPTVTMGGKEVRVGEGFGRAIRDKKDQMVAVAVDKGVDAVVGEARHYAEPVYYIQSAPSIETYRLVLNDAKRTSPALDATTPNTYTFSTDPRSTLFVNGEPRTICDKDQKSADVDCVCFHHDNCATDEYCSEYECLNENENHELVPGFEFKSSDSASTSCDSLDFAWFNPDTLHEACGWTETEQACWRKCVGKDGCNAFTWIPNSTNSGGKCRLVGKQWEGKLTGVNEAAGCYAKGPCNNNNGHYTEEALDAWGCENKNACNDEAACGDRAKDYHEYCENTPDQKFTTVFYDGSGGKSKTEYPRILECNKFSLEDSFESDEQEIETNRTKCTNATCLWDNFSYECEAPSRSLKMVDVPLEETDAESTKGTAISGTRVRTADPMATAEGARCVSKCQVYAGAYFCYTDSAKNWGWCSSGPERENDAPCLFNEDCVNTCIGNGEAGVTLATRSDSTARGYCHHRR